MAEQNLHFSVSTLQGSEPVTKASVTGVGPAAGATRNVRIGLVGFGRTGHEVARSILLHDSVSLEWVVRRRLPAVPATVSAALAMECDQAPGFFSCSESSAAWLLTEHPVDVIIDFSAEKGIEFYGEAAAAHGVAIVTAISHYAASHRHILEALSKQTAVCWAPNVTLGINFLLPVARVLQRIEPSADVQIIEEHFAAKREVSGTAKRIAQELDVDAESIHSVRAGGIVGVHEVLFGLATQIIRIRHESISRAAFGDGAIFAALHLVGRSAGLYRMEDLFAPYFADLVNANDELVAPGRSLRSRLAHQLRKVAKRLG